jgi:nicotinate-nucleotide adenylyltransferase
LESVIFIPAGEPPHKRRQAVTSAAHRLAMVELAIAGNPGFRTSRIEVDRSGPSFSSDTVAALQAEHGPEAELYFIVGQDALADILTWHEPDRLIALCHLVAIRRPGVREPDMAALEAAIPGASRRVILLSAPELNISATNLRWRVGSGLPIRYQVPEAVVEYIHRHELYGHTLASRPLA